MSRPLIYISGPITKGDPASNFAQADNANAVLVAFGFAPLNPMFSMKSAYADTIDHAAWLEVDLAWLAHADVVLRLPGESKGADIECEFARQKGIPVYDSLTACCQDIDKFRTADREAKLAVAKRKCFPCCKCEEGCDES